MTPFFFGESQQPLFGVYHPARHRSNRGVVVCAPWAREYLLAHSTLKLLAHRLSEAGWHVLRFDYHGTGDSAGDSKSGSQRQWVADVRAAMDELKDVADVREVALVGMRLGATIAALTAAECRDIRRVVLWDPVQDGRAYLTELGVSPDLPTHDDVDAQGAVLTPRLRSEFEGITTATFGELPRTLVVSTDPHQTAAPLVTFLRDRGVDCAIEYVPDVQVWREEWGRGGKGLAVQATNIITQWLN